MSLTLYLMRHGIAASGNIADSERGLTETGREQVEELSRGISSLEPTIELALVSPLRRAQETAAIMWRAVGGAGLRPDARAH